MSSDKINTRQEKHKINLDIVDKFRNREDIDLADFIQNIPLETYLDNVFNVFDLDMYDNLIAESVLSDGT